MGPAIEYKHNTVESELYWYDISAISYIAHYISWGIQITADILPASGAPWP